MSESIDDWATDLARLIMLDMSRSFSSEDAVKLIAARLRLLAFEHEGIAIDRVLAVIKSKSKSNA